MTEFEFVSSTVSLIRSRHPHVKMCVEAPIMGRSVDVAFIRGNRTVAIEFKLKDWKRAIVQASDYKLACDLAYICLPQARISEEVIKCARINGVGILVVESSLNWPFKTIVNAIPSKEKSPRASTFFRNYILEDQDSTHEHHK